MRKYSFHPRVKTYVFGALIALGPLLAAAGLLMGTRIWLGLFFPVYAVASLGFLYEVVHYIAVDQQGLTYFSLTKRCRMKWDDITAVEIRQLGRRRALCFFRKPLDYTGVETIGPDFIMTFNLDPALLAWVTHRWGPIVQKQASA